MLARALLAIDNPILQRQLRKRLAERDVIVDIVRSKSKLWARVGREICDLIVVSHDRVPAPAVESIETLMEVPDAPAIVMLTDSGNVEEVAALQAAGCKAVVDSDVPVPGLLDVLEAVLEDRMQEAQARLAARHGLSTPRLSDFVSNSPSMQAFLSVAERVTSSDISVLLLGETGVGKERLAQAIHYEGLRSTGPFIAINCGALPESLLESELFGHEQGAFTGATRSRRGCFELAHGGTVFLDEIGELPLHLQVKLLRVLQEREVRRLGSERAIGVDVRIMAATNRDLEGEVEQKTFRQDLYYRLGVMTLKIPPLRQRREDIPDLVENFIAYMRPRVRAEVRGIEADALAAMLDYAWPGNVRELMNVIERAMLLAPADKIGLGELPAAIGQKQSLPQPAATVPRAMVTTEDDLPAGWEDRPWKEIRQEILDRAERAYLAGILRLNGGRIGETADHAGMETRSLYEKMRRHGLRKEDFKRPRRRNQSQGL